MKRLALAPVVAALGLLSACSTGPTIRSDYDHSANFAQYHSFGFMSPLGTDKAGYTTLLTERLKTATRSQMEMRGYVFTEQSPDLLVNFNAKLQQKTEVTPGMPMPMPMGPYYGYRAGFYGGWPGYGWGNDVFQYTEGTLNIDLIDARRKQLVWEGVSTGMVNNPATADSLQNVAEEVAQIFQQYPFRAGSDTPQNATATSAGQAK
ncbi:DUF4136 domain-containing protein [Bordetella sp. 15P40C-2]|uniref:DUF4136 domain-containing protein n=1 Tax=Bordetella sp. 15P40C-2 TaxID=2572246 RepID=UPI0013228565|nr:DUF4136 domain-containing protein [Bordetella sp. 15P40C-2]MVW73665.1 DUF4136 domain-containing protein [Bordetella sp. 15P40C-2]